MLPTIKIRIGTRAGRTNTAVDREIDLISRVEGTIVVFAKVVIKVTARTATSTLIGKGLKQVTPTCHFGAEQYLRIILSLSAGGYKKCSPKQPGSEKKLK